MSNRGPIIIIEDDLDDQQLIHSALEHLKVKNPIIMFQDTEHAYTYLIENCTQPFLILCDINMPRVNGFEFRRRILAHEGISRKSIPFIFISTSDSYDLVREAYSLVVQGYFNKKYLFEEQVAQLDLIIKYWTECRHPNND